MMNRELQKTLRPGSLRHQVTLPAVSGAKVETVQSGPCRPGDVVDGLEVERRIGQGVQSTLYLAKAHTGERCLLKVYAPDKVMDQVARSRLTRLRCPALVPIRSIGVWQGHHYECMQLLRGEPLANRMPMEEEQVKQQVLPAVVQALQALHGMRLLHNDLKPENLFWDEDREQVVVLDYGNVTGFDNKQDMGGTPVYMAPETLFSQGKFRSAASDYCALGLTVGALINGSPLLEGDDVRKLRMVWQRSIRIPGAISAQTRILLNGLIDSTLERRWNIARIEKWMQTNGIQYQPSGKATAKVNATRKENTFRPLRFAGQLVLDIPELIDAIRGDWSTGVFVLREHQLEPFLSQFGQEYYDVCRRCSEIFDRDEALFRMVQELVPGPEIIWCGRSFSDLNEMIRYTETEENLESSLLVRFCRRRLLGFYLEKNGATGPQLEFTRRLEDLVRSDPELAFQRLKLSMEEKPTFRFRDHVLRDRKDLFALLSGAETELDAIVEELCDSQKFEAWLDFQQLGDVLPRVRAEMEVYR